MERLENLDDVFQQRLRVGDGRASLERAVEKHGPKVTLSPVGGVGTIAPENTAGSIRSSEPRFSTPISLRAET
jgi:hypothetical protein